jgi:Protein of unknown function (DUF2505)
MPRSFGVSVESPVSVEQVHGAFAEEDYWQARFAAFDTSTTLDALTVDPEGTVRVTTTQDLRHDGLPRLVARFYPGDLKILSTETWTPIGSRRVSGEISISVAGAPGSGRGEALLAPQGIGSQLNLNGTVEFNVPLVGGRIETYLGNQLAKQIPQIQRFTTAWIGNRP